MELGVLYLPNCMLRIHFNLVWEGLFIVACFIHDEMESWKGASTQNNVLPKIST